MKLRKLMVNGYYIKINNKFIYSIGYFAYDGCHKIYMLEDDSDVKTAMEYGYRLYPDIELEKTYDKSCPLKFISNFKLDICYIQQFCQPKWSKLKVNKKELEKFIKLYYK